MKISKRLEQIQKSRIKFAIETIVLLLLCAYLAINVGNLKAVDTEKSSAGRYTGTRIPNTNTEIYVYDSYDMEILRDSVNAGNDYAGKTVNVMEDIDLSYACSKDLGSWEPIGTYYTNFEGTFNGNYHTIKNLYINTEEYQTLGLFKKTGENTIIKNLLLEEVDITSTYATPANNTYVGGIVGWQSEGSEIINCGIKNGTILDEILVDGSNSQYGPVIGGIAGRANGRIEGCYNKATIIGTASRNTGSTDVMAGGITGAGRGKITNCYNTGNVVGTSYENFVGGVIGNADNSYTGKVANTYNKGEITHTASVDYVGGIIGRNGFMTDYEAIEFENSYATNSSINSYYPPFRRFARHKVP